MVSMISEVIYLPGERCGSVAIKLLLENGAEINGKKIQKVRSQLTKMKKVGWGGGGCRQFVVSS